MSKKITEKELNRKIGKYNSTVRYVNSLNKYSATRVEAGMFTREDYEQVININLSRAQEASDIARGKGYLNGYADGSKDCANIAIAGLVAGTAFAGVVAYRKEIKEYGKYVIGKLRKKEQ